MTRSNWEHRIGFKCRYRRDAQRLDWESKRTTFKLEYPLTLPHKRKANDRAKRQKQKRKKAETEEEIPDKPERKGQAQENHNCTRNERKEKEADGRKTKEHGPTGR
jgi:hypothetical protein